MASCRATAAGASMTAPGGTSRTTVALAPMRASPPTVTGPTTTAPAPLLTRSPITG
jgi:hypothetical protein